MHLCKIWMCKNLQNGYSIHKKTKYPKYPHYAWYLRNKINLYLRFIFLVIFIKIWFYIKICLKMYNLSLTRVRSKRMKRSYKKWSWLRGIGRAWIGYPDRTSSIDSWRSPLESREYVQTNALVCLVAIKVARGRPKVCVKEALHSCFREDREISINCL